MVPQILQMMNAQLAWTQSLGDANVISFAAGVAVGTTLGGNIDWRRNRVDVVNRCNKFNHTNIADNTWRHDPHHRGMCPIEMRM